MNLSCPRCHKPFGPLGTKSASRLLLCGDSYCEECVDHLTNNERQHSCIKCKVSIDFQCDTPPINKTYYEMMQLLHNYQARRKFNAPEEPKSEDADKKALLYDDKCLNPFCFGRRFSNEDVFCSKRCMDIHEELFPL